MAAKEGSYPPDAKRTDRECKCGVCERSTGREYGVAGVLVRGERDVFQWELASRRATLTDLARLPPRPEDEGCS